MVQAVNNIACIRIPMNGVDNQYLLPYSTAFKDKKVKRFIFADTSNGGANANYYLTLYDRKNRLLLSNFSHMASYYEIVPHMCELDSVLSWESSFVRIRGDVASSAGKILTIYVVYDEYRNIKDRYTLIKSIELPNQYNGSLKKFIDGKFGVLKKIDISQKKEFGDNPKGAITLKCKSGRSVNNVDLSIFSPTFVSLPFNPNPLYFADYDIDFQTSTISTQNSNVILTLYFGNP